MIWIISSIPVFHFLLYGKSSKRKNCQYPFVWFKILKDSSSQWLCRLVIVNSIIKTHWKLLLLAVQSWQLDSPPATVQTRTSSLLQNGYFWGRFWFFNSSPGSNHHGGDPHGVAGGPAGRRGWEEGCDVMRRSNIPSIYIRKVWQT